MRVRSIITVVAAAAVVAVVTVMLANGSRGSNPATATARGPQTAAEQIARAEQVLRDEPNNDDALANLASASLTRVKETADSTWYNRADSAARAALAINPDNVLALESLATLANARHRFADAVAPATKALRLAPDRFASLEILTDAQIELGRYKDGFVTAETRLQSRPDLSSYSRASYAAELRGERALAIALMDQAVDAARAGSGDRAWAQVQLGLLRLGSGDLNGARREMRAARVTAPNDAIALAGDAHVQAVTGRLDEAAALYRKALAIQQIAGSASSLAEIEEARGNRAAATEALELSRQIDAREAVNGVQLDLDQAQVEADFARPDAAQVAKARRGHAFRPGVIGDDALGWVLTRSGRCEEGLRYARRSLRIGTQDATMLFHAGMAARCAGDAEAAAGYLRRALDLNPRFSVRWSETAKSTLAELTAG